MIELMIKMTFWIMASMILGFIVAWLLSRIMYQREQSAREETFSALILDRDNMLDTLEKNYDNKNKMFEEALAEKTSRLTTLQNKIDNISPHESLTLELKENNSLLLIKNQKLENIDMQRVKELEGLEEVLLLAEEKTEESEKSSRQIVKKLDESIELLTIENEKYKDEVRTYQKNITYFKEELKLYKADTSEPEFIISQDQFIKIEEQLTIYQKEIEFLKHENSESFLTLEIANDEVLSDEQKLEDKTADELDKRLDDGSMVKVFRETYTKITKS